MTCSKCKFWERFVWEKHDGSIVSEKYGDCKSDKIIYLVAEEYGESDREIPLDGIGYKDHERYRVELNIGENFGCIHFVHK